MTHERINASIVFTGEFFGVGAIIPASALTRTLTCPTVLFLGINPGGGMAEIASGVAIVLALAALWLANAALAQVSSTFEEYSVALAKQVREAQDEYERKAERLRAECKELLKTINSVESRAKDNAEKVHLLTQRIGVLEHELKSLSDSIPPQFRRPVKLRDGKSA